MEASILLLGSSGNCIFLFAYRGICSSYVHYRLSRLPAAFC